MACGATTGSSGPVRRSDVVDVVADDEQRPSARDRSGSLGKDRAFAAGNVEIRDEDEIEGLRGRLVHGEIGFDPVDVDAGRRGSLTGLTESLGREVDGCHTPPSLGKPQRMAAVAAAEVERASRCEAVEGVQHDRARLAVGVEELVRPAAIPVAGVQVSSPGRRPARRLRAATAVRWRRHRAPRSARRSRSPSSPRRRSRTPPAVELARP